MSNSERAPGQKAMNFGPSAKRLIGKLGAERSILLLVLVLAALSVGFNVVGPKILGQATDVVFSGAIGAQLPAGVDKADIVAQLRAEGQTTYADMLERLDLVPGQGIDFDALGRTLAMVLGFYATAAICAWLQGYLLNGAVQRSIYRLRNEVEDKINRLPLSYFDKQPRGELLSRVTNDIDNISQTLQQTMSQLLNALFTVIGVLVMMFWVSPLLAVITLASVPVTMVVTVLVGRRSQKLFIQQWGSTGDLNAHVEEAYTGHALVKVFGRQREVEAEFAKRNEELFKASFGAQFVSGLIMPLMMFVGNLSFVAVAVVGGLRVASGDLNLGSAQAFIQYQRMFTQPLSQIGSMANLLQSGVASAERVFEVLDEPEQSPDATGALEPTRGRIAFRDVDFSYSADSELITGLNLSVEPGQTVAIVGPTGAGKTTLVNLVMRFYEIDSGEITIDGVDIRTVPRADLRSKIGMVLQDTWLFHGTIRENIAYGRPDATEEEIIEAATATYVDRFVHSLPDGYDTVIDEEGSNVSAGEKQLITIARAFLADPALLILDEATSSVDTRTEVLVQEAMSRLRSDRTSFVIAHRLSTIRDADVILVMEDGHIVEQGNHATLIDVDGHYAELYRTQFAAPTT
ncbi:MAG TPA: ABC transporter ATP-binding protein [Candidatus Avipropionibacterium avicola]|uniref:Fatty acid ABC transporter ATP-binding/permease protein n=1 Tax=Candidatus Avipropionibacterium avicola TaxID=2840701 RepID=A0A9D1H033_9ACTN|nr:ABC transporter ATP-binding protein [Candidatus Avipropionibacterium avicola]